MPPGLSIIILARKAKIVLDGFRYNICLAEGVI